MRDCLASSQKFCNTFTRYVDRKQSLNVVREKAGRRSSDIVVAEQSLSEAEQQLKQVVILLQSAVPAHSNVIFVLQAATLQTKSLDALSKQREARLALMNDKIMEQKYIETQDQLERLRIKEAELLEQQNVLNDSIAAYEAMHLHLEEQKKTQVSPYLSDFTHHFAARFYSKHCLLLCQARVLCCSCESRRRANSSLMKWTLISPAA